MLVHKQLLQPQKGLSKPAATPTSKEPISAGKTTKGSVSVVSKYLGIPTDSTPKRSVPHAKLLTSADALRKIEEKEKKKRDVLGRSTEKRGRMRS